MIATPQAAEHPRRVVDFAYTRRRAWTPATQPGDAALPARIVLELDNQRFTDPKASSVQADVPLVLENLRDVGLELGVQQKLTSS